MQNFPHKYLILVEATGLAPLAARPAKRLPIVCFAIKIALPKRRKAKHFAPAKWLFSRKVRFSLRSVTANAKFIRLLISSLQGITNALLNGQLVPQVRPDMRRQNKTPTLKEDRGFVVPLIGLEPIRYFYRGILSPLRLPIPPQRRSF